MCHILDGLKNGCQIRLIGDNVNWFVKVHDEILGHTSQMKHAFASAFVVDNVPPHDSVSADIRPQNDHMTFDPMNYLPSQSDCEFMARKYECLIVDILTSYLPCFMQYRHVVDSFIKTSSTQIGEVVKQTLSVLPVLLKNEQKYDDVTDILDSYEDSLHSACSKAEVDVSNVKVQLSGDQLTRERFSGAKCLRAHHPLPRDRYKHLTPITFGFFHMHMNFLQVVIFNRLFKSDSVREIGTLRNLKERLGRKQVSDDVKNAFDADNEFLKTVTRAYVILAALQYFGMADINSATTKHVISTDEQFLEHVKHIVEKFVTQHDCPIIGKIDTIITFCLYMIIFEGLLNDDYLHVLLMLIVVVDCEL